MFGSYGYVDKSIIRVGINNRHYINYFKFQDTWNTLNVVPPYDITLYLSCYDTKYKAIVNGVVNEWDNNNMAYQVQNRELVLFENIPNNNTYFNGDIASFRVSDPTFTTDKLHFIPCKLLKPVPKWLDANGIRRQVGECGMIDLVSGKFYGNVNSVGTFTVENYYERKEWLQGDGSAYMQISQTSRTDFNINLTYKLSNVYKQMLYGSFYSTSGGWKGNMLTWGETNGIADKILLRINTNNGNNYINLGAQNIDVVHTIKVVDGRCYFDDVDRGVCPGYSIYNYDKPFLLFNGYNVDTITESNASNASISKFSIEGYCNLIPCTLTMDLPASMDANNIARTKGTSGMWDLVSDRFYGNVASSGTFKAVNLAEGVDYEVHDKLIMHGTSGGYGANMKFAESPISLSEKIMRVNIGLNRIFIICTSPHYYLAIYSYGSSGLFIVRQWAASDPNNVIFFQQTHIDGQELVVNFSTGKMQYGEYEGNIISNETYTVQASQNYYESPHNSKTVRNFKIDGVIDLIPVKLLHSIPSKYDANGIARQAGECGMYDTVNDLFYGNVASSGTFSVSDDS